MKKITSKKNANMRTLSVRIPSDLYESLEAFHQALKAFDDTMILDVNELVTIALRRDLRMAQEELEKLKTVTLKPPPVRQSTLTPPSASTGGRVASAQEPIPTPASASPTRPTTAPPQPRQNPE